ncbi:MAG: hypothetical protein ACKVWV_12015 [Planctomycetota bacterium]
MMRWLVALACVLVGLGLLWTWMPSAPPVETVVVDERDPSARESDARPAALLEMVEESARSSAAPVAAPIDVLGAAAAVPGSAPIAPTEPFDLTVRVLCPDGEICRNVRVYCETCVSADRSRSHATILESETDAEGRAGFHLGRLRDAPCLVVRATAHPRLTSPMHVLRHPRALPADVELTLQRACELHVVVQDENGLELPGVRVALNSRARGEALVVDAESSGSRGNVAFEVPAGSYELVARGGTPRAEARTNVALAGDQVVTLVLAKKEDPIAVSGIVVDESGRGLEQVTVTAERPSGEMLRGNQVQTDFFFDGHERRSITTWSTKRTAVTDALGAFEIRMPVCDVLDVRVAGEPLFATYEPSTARVAYGTTGLVLRRTHAWKKSVVRVDLIDADSRARILDASFAMRVAGDETRQFKARGLGGCIEVGFPERDDVTWRIEAHGYHTIEGDIVALRSRIRDGSLEIVLASDPTAPKGPIVRIHLGER